MQFTKRDFKILKGRYNEVETCERHGWVCSHFGIHKTQKGNYAITHLPSGRRAGVLVRVANARALVRELLALNIPWSTPEPFYAPGGCGGALARDAAALVTRYVLSEAEEFRV